MSKDLALKYDAAWLVINTVRYYKGLYVTPYVNKYYGEGVIPKHIASIIHKLQTEGRYAG